jgi:ubiquinone/menaquinone biosynthesis C-methylase UbiE
MGGAKRLTGRRWRSTVRQNWEQSAPGWSRWEATLLHILSAVDLPLLRALDLRPGHRLLDLACGPGEPGIGFAEWVRPGGSVVGVDVSRQMLRQARARARSRGAKNVRFVQGDLGRLPVRSLGRFDRIVSRFGIFFVEDLEGTLETIHGMLKPEGRAAFAVWGPTSENAAWGLRCHATAPFVEGEPEPEYLPHPMRLARKGLLARLLRRAGYQQVHTAAVRVPFVLPSAEEYWEMSVDTSSTLHQFVAGLTRRQRETVRRRLLRAARPYEKEGVLRLPGLAWVVSGRR